MSEKESSTEEFDERVSVCDYEGTPSPPVCIEAAKNELLTEYDVTLSQLRTLQTRVEEVSVSVITNVFDTSTVDGLDNGITLIYRQVLSDVVTMIHEQNWPVRKSDYVFDELIDAIPAETPKEYVDGLITVLQVDDEESSRYIDAKISRIHQHTKQDSVINEYVYLQREKQASDVERKTKC